MEELEGSAAREGKRTPLPASSETEALTTDRYVAGGVPWENYSHRQLFDMLHEHADLSATYEGAIRWRDHGEAIEFLSGQFNRLLTSLAHSWTGKSADNALELLGQNAAWLADLAHTAADMGTTVSTAADQLAAAQRAMPVPRDQATGASLGAGFGSDATGGESDLLASVIGTVLGGTTSVLGDMLDERSHKDWAVQVMRDHEQGAMEIDDSTPQFAGTLSTITSLVAAPTIATALNRTPSQATAGRSPQERTHDTQQAQLGDRSSGLDTTQLSTAPSWSAVGPEARWQAMTAASSGLTAGNHPAGRSPAAQAAVGGLAAGGDVTAQGRAQEESAGAAGSSSETSKRRRSPYEYDLFGDLDRSAPAVIGE
ncbi:MULTISPECIES: hypothetical protein [Actinosynnema]|uniref:hypothetical protein n=1 Tax=Actinosynnema TaxID=40566 RepID=UPI0020A4E311|nr:hypothetical protein [Actinosynnema pretiosum]MCP2092261.1 PPE family [Actinosynnema pretiosum]